MERRAVVIQYLHRARRRARTGRGKVTLSGADKRRSTRIPMRCTATVREKIATWTTETRDVSVRGCRIVLRRPLTPGMLVHIAIERGGDAPPLEFVGQVAWARKAAPLFAGVTFVSAPRDPAGGSTGAWIDMLVASELRRALGAGPAGVGILDALGNVMLHLGTPPGGSLGAGELAVIRASRQGASLSSLYTSPDGVQVVLGLLERGAVTVRRTNADPEGWRRALSLLTDSATAAKGRAASTASPEAVIVPPLPDTIWRRAAVGAVPAGTE
jgi:hypothetical protein